MIDPDRNKSFKVYADADFCGNCRRPIIGANPSTAKSCTGYSIMYAVWPIIWWSKLQTEIALSSTEVAITQYLHDVNPMI